MNDAMYVAASGMNAVQQALDNSTHNLVNSQTPGFQSRRVVMQNFGSYLDVAEEQEDMIGAREVIAFEQGDLRQDDNPLAMAIEGEGFFMIRPREKGPTYYSRNGEFAINSKGQLATHGGYPVLDSQGGTIDVDSRKGPIRVQLDGTILQGESEIAKLGLVQFKTADRNRLTAASETLFAAPAEVKPVAADATLVHQGYLELPKYTIQGVVEMLIATRGYETMQRTLRTLDQVQDNAIRSVS